MKLAQSGLFEGHWKWLNYTHLVLLPIVIGINIIILSSVLQTNREIIKIANDTNRLAVAQEQQESSRAKTVESIENAMLCVVTFFAQTDRQNVYITNIRDCEVTNVETGETRRLDTVPVEREGSGDTSNSDPKAAAQ